MTGVNQSVMRQVIVSKEHGAAIEVVDRPTPASGEALIRMTSVGICGSDVHAFHGRHPFVPLPYAPGHEVIGIVEALASDVAGPAVGSRVVVEPTLPCWDCKNCRSGRINLCENLKFFGCVYDQGGMADYFTVPANRLHIVPDGLSDRQAVLIEPLATPVHAVRIAGSLQGKSVVILGAGTIGLLVLATALDAGARQVVVTDMVETKRQHARALGAHAVVDAAAADVADEVRHELGESADVVFDCVAIASTVDQAIRMAVKGGTVVIVGVPSAPVTIPLPQLQDYQINIQGSAMYTTEDYAEAIRLLLAGKVRPDDIITAEFPLERVADGFAAAVSGEHTKVILTAGTS